MALLEESRRLGFLGPGPVEPHVSHALGFAAAAGEGSPGKIVDLGSGGGVPGLVLALTWSDAEVVLLEANQRRSSFLLDAVERLELEPGRVRVERERAEVVGHQPGYRGHFDMVAARSFGPPPLVAECGAPLLRDGGKLVVSDPPGAGDVRWPAEGLAQLGLVDDGAVRQGGAGYRVLVRRGTCPDRFPDRKSVV